MMANALIHESGRKAFVLRVGRFDHIIQVFAPVKKDQGYLINVVCDENGISYYFGLFLNLYGGK